MSLDSSENNRVLQQAAQGDAQVLGTLLARNQNRLRLERLSRAEIAQVLGVSESAADKRYIRALERLKQVLGRALGGLEGLRP